MLVVVFRREAFFESASILAGDSSAGGEFCFVSRYNWPLQEIPYCFGQESSVGSVGFLSLGAAEIKSQCVKQIRF